MLNLRLSIYKQWRQILLAACLIIWPLTSNLFLKSAASYSSGKWLAWETLVLNPIQLVILAYLFWVIIKKRDKWLDGLIVLSGIIAIISFPEFLTSTINLLVILLGLNNYKELQIRKYKWLIPSLLLGHSLLAIGQFILQKDLGLQIINEPFLNYDIKGIAKLFLPSFDFAILRSYSTFAHPNVLSAFLSLLTLLVITNKDLSQKQKLALVLVGSLGLLTTFSRSIIYLPILLAWTYRKELKKIAIPLTLIIITTVSIYGVRQISPHTDQSNAERFQQIQTLGQSSNTKILPWEQEPIHNTYLEAGQRYKLGLLILIALFALILKQNPKLRNNKALWLLLAIGLTDHFLLTLPMGGYLLLSSTHSATH